MNKLVQGETDEMNIFEIGDNHLYFEILDRN